MTDHYASDPDPSKPIKVPKNLRTIRLDELLDVLEDSGKEVLGILKPYLPALGRVGEDVYEGFLKHLFNADWTKIDRLMYEHMTEAERDELDQEVYKDAYYATAAKYRRKELIKEVLTKVAIRIAIKLATAGVL
jgi:hypothetical protein